MAKGSWQQTTERIRNGGGGGKNIEESQRKTSQESGATIKRDAGTENDAEIPPGVLLSHRNKINGTCA